MYTVMGATGNTGKVVVEELLARGQRVRAVVRDANKAQGLAARGVELVAASYDSVPSLVAALGGAAGAYVMLPPNVDRADMVSAAREQTDALAVALAEARVPHVVHLSSIGAQHAQGTGPIVGLHYTEQRLRSATGALTSLRAPFFMENWASSLPALSDGVLPSMLPLDKAIPMIATVDIGRIAAAALSEGARGHRVLELAGPAEYAPRDIAKALSAILGRTITATLVPADALVASFESFGFNRRNAEIYAELFTSIASGKASAEGGHDVARGKTPIERVLRSLLGA